MEPREVLLENERKTANWIIYASIIIGLVLIAQLYSLVPSWLFTSILAGWVAYVLVGIGVALRVAVAYPASLVLAVLTLVVSLPQPEHYSFGLSLASGTFITGSVLQIGVIVSVARYLLSKRR